MTTPNRLRASERRKKVWPFRNPTDPRGAVVLMKAHLEALKVKGYSSRTYRAIEWSLSDFIVWCEDRGVVRLSEVTKPILERYQRLVFYHRKEDGQPLTMSTQYTRLTFIKQFFRWLTRNNYILSNPASELELPKVEKRLPKFILSAQDVEAVMAQPDIEKHTGLRDRAMLETLYSTGVRRTEASKLKIFDVDLDRGILAVRQGKGHKDRFIPIGERATAWINKYLQDARPSFAVEPDGGFLFLSRLGDPISAATLSILVSRYVEKADIGKHGSCHLFRHAMATLMLENGADIRMIQAMLGHVKLTTTEIYTHVSIKKLKEIHTATHPSARLECPALLAALKAEDDHQADDEGRE